MMTPIVTDTDITEKLLFVSNQYPTHEPPITDFHFGDLGEIVVLNFSCFTSTNGQIRTPEELQAASALLMRQLDDGTAGNADVCSRMLTYADVCGRPHLRC